MTGAGTPNRASLVIGNTIAEMSKVVAFVESFGAEHTIPPAVINDVNLCVDELLNNTISYGYADQGLHNITVVISLAHGAVTVEIQDDGKPFDPQNVPAAAIEGTLRTRRIGGLGVHFVRTLMDEIGYRRVGERNVVTIIKRLCGDEGNGHS